MRTTMKEVVFNLRYGMRTARNKFFIRPIQIDLSYKCNAGTKVNAISYVKINRLNCVINYNKYICRAVA